MKYTALLALVLIVITSCNNASSTNLKNDDSSRITLPKQVDKVILLENNNSIVWGDDTVNKSSIVSTEVKFEPYISFRDFTVNSVYKGDKAELQLKKGDDNWMFRTRIRDGYKDSINFGGHYRFIIWGCGSPCQAAVLVDVMTGGIYPAPGAALGYEFYVDSKMLIVNPPAKENQPNSPYATKKGYYTTECEYCHPYIYVWDEELKIFEERKPVYH